MKRAAAVKPVFREKICANETTTRSEIVILFDVLSDEEKIGFP